MKIKKWSLVFMFALTNLNTQSSSQDETAKNLQEHRNQKIAQANAFRIKLGLPPLEIEKEQTPQASTPANPLQATESAPKRPAPLNLSVQLNTQPQSSTTGAYPPTTSQVKHPHRAAVARRKKSYQPFNMFARSKPEATKQKTTEEPTVVKDDTPEKKILEKIFEQQIEEARIAEERKKEKPRYNFGMAWLRQYQKDREERIKNKIIIQKQILASKTRMDAVAETSRKRKDGGRFHFDTTGTNIKITKKK